MWVAFLLVLSLEVGGKTSIGILLFDLDSNILGLLLTETMLKDVSKLGQNDVQIPVKFYRKCL